MLAVTKTPLSVQMIASFGGDVKPFALSSLSLHISWKATLKNTWHRSKMFELNARSRKRQADDIFLPYLPHFVPLGLCHPSLSYSTWSCMILWIVPTYSPPPPLNPKLAVSSHFQQAVGLRVAYVCSFPESYSDPKKAYKMHFYLNYISSAQHLCWRLRKLEKCDWFLTF